jgi:hypothetical protein
MIRALLIVLALSGVVPAAALADDPTPDSENGRYTFSQTPQGVLRLDSRSGHVALCRQRAAGWACEVAPDERAALETELARLQAESATLKRELIAHNLSLPKGMQPPATADAASDDVVVKLPSNAEMQRVMGFFERAWRRFVEVVQNMQRDPDKRG